MGSAYQHCEALVRAHDRERYLATLFAAADKRRHLIALYAFDLELRRLPDAVREPMAGEIRLQWWRDVLAGERDSEALSNPVSAALLKTLHEAALPRSHLFTAVDARQFDLISQPTQTYKELATYLDETTGSIMTVAANVLDPQWDAAVAAQSAGRAQGVTQILRSLAHDVSHGRLFVPLETLAAKEVHTASVMAGENSEGLREALGILRELAAASLHQFRSLDIGERVLPAFLQLALLPAYFTRMKRAADPLRTSAELSGLRSQFLLWRAARSGKV
jgi:phytoene synthase